MTGKWFENLKIPIIGSKIKVVVNFIYGYQNLSGEKCKANEERISSIGLTSLEKNPKNCPKCHFSEKQCFRVFFGFVSKLVSPIELILSSLVLYFSSGRFWYPYIKFTTTFIFDPLMGIFKFSDPRWRVKEVEYSKNLFTPMILIYSDSEFHL